MTSVTLGFPGKGYHNKRDLNVSEVNVVTLSDTDSSNHGEEVSEKQ